MDGTPIPKRSAPPFLTDALSAYCADPSQLNQDRLQAARRLTPIWDTLDRLGVPISDDALDAVAALHRQGIRDLDTIRLVLDGVPQEWATGWTA